ncbi:hypothetical protein ACIP5Y_21400 [Nocardia sp. NPDC088792]|uniref:hypothetical protein n=1 Tax=Nocardia sp. NPDC088792 TaxID=3364332 RepID=UPI0038266B92
MSVELVSMISALAGVVGSLGGIVVTQRYTIRGKQVDAENLRRSEADKARLSMYADYNAAARGYRTAALDFVEGRTETLAAVKARRSDYRDLYARAQMSLPDPVLAVASEVSNCLDRTYDALCRLDAGHTDVFTAESLLVWVKGPLNDGIHLLRKALRVDLGTSHDEDDVADAVRLLSQARHAMFAPMTPTPIPSGPGRKPDSRDL